MRPVPREPIPFSTPRAWASLSQALDLAEAAGILHRETLARALAFGRLSPQDAAILLRHGRGGSRDVQPAETYVHHPPDAHAGHRPVVVLSRIRALAQRRDLRDVPPATITALLSSLPSEHRAALLVDLVEVWGSLGADDAMLDTLKEVTGL